MSCDTHFVGMEWAGAWGSLSMKKMLLICWRCYCVYHGEVQLNSNAHHYASLIASWALLIWSWHTRRLWLGRMCASVLEVNVKWSQLTAGNHCLYAVMLTCGTGGQEGPIHTAVVWQKVDEGRNTCVLKTRDWWFPWEFVSVRPEYSWVSFT